MHVENPFIHGSASLRWLVWLVALSADAAAFGNFRIHTHTTNGSYVVPVDLHKQVFSRWSSQSTHFDLVTNPKKHQPSERFLCAVGVTLHATCQATLPPPPPSSALASKRFHTERQRTAKSQRRSQEHSSLNSQLASIRVERTLIIQRSQIDCLH